MDRMTKTCILPISHILFVILLLGSKAKIMLVEKLFSSQGKMYRLYRKNDHNLSFFYIHVQSAHYFLDTKCWGIYRSRSDATELPHSLASDQDLHCLPLMQIFKTHLQVGRLTC